MPQQTQGQTEILNMESSSSEEKATCHGGSLSFGAWRARTGRAILNADRVVVATISVTRKVCGVKGAQDRIRVIESSFCSINCDLTNSLAKDSAEMLSSGQCTHRTGFEANSERQAPGKTR